MRRHASRPNINRFCIWSAKRPGRTRRSWVRFSSWFCLPSRDKARSKPGSWTTRALRKKGTHSVGVARQYCGRLGKQDNCQVAVTLSIANHTASLPIAYRLYMPEAWANDQARRKKAHIPKEIEFKTKPQIALDQIRAAHAAGVAPGVVLADAGYGVNGGFRAGVTALDLPYVVGVQSTLTVWPPGQEPLPAKPWSGHGRKPSRLNRDLEHQPVTVKELALSLKKKAWRSLTWREGSNTPLASRFAAVRLRPASRDCNRTKPHPLEWLIVEWPNEEAEPTKYWLSTLPKDTPLQDLVDKAKLRWRIERDYEELKGVPGMGTGLEVEVLCGASW